MVGLCLLYSISHGWLYQRWCGTLFSVQYKSRIAYLEFEVPAVCLLTVTSLWYNTYFKFSVFCLYFCLKISGFFFYCRLFVKVWSISQRKPISPNRSKKKTNITQVFIYCWVDVQTFRLWFQRFWWNKGNSHLLDSETLIDVRHNFTLFSTIFQLYKDDGMTVVNGFEQWKSIYCWKDFCLWESNLWLLDQKARM